MNAVQENTTWVGCINRMCSWWNNTQYPPKAHPLGLGDYIEKEYIQT